MNFRHHWMHGILFAATILLIVLNAAILHPQDLPLPQVPAAEDEEEPPREIAAVGTPQQDRMIKNRLKEIFSQIEGIENLDVRVQSGVVTLRGEALSQKARSQAIELSRQVEGVVEVNDETTLERNLTRQIVPVVERLRDLASDAVGYLSLIVAAVIIFLFFWLLAFLLGKWGGLYRRLTRNQFLIEFIRQLTQLAVLAIGLLVAFELLDATALMGAVMGAAGLMGLAIGFALRDTVENYIAGILLSTKQPFVHDDWVDIEGQEGRILRLTSRATIIMTLDGNHVRIPNAKVFNGVVINYTRNPQRRFYFDIGVSSDTCLQDAQRLAATTLLGVDGILNDPPPNVDVQELGEFNITLRVYGWVDQRYFSYLKVKSEATRLVKEAFDDAGIVMPSQIVRVRMEKAEEAAGKARAGSKQAVDVSLADGVKGQIAEERRESREPDLLTPDAPLE